MKSVVSTAPHYFKVAETKKNIFMMDQAGKPTFNNFIFK